MVKRIDSISKDRMTEMFDCLKAKLTSKTNLIESSKMKSQIKLIICTITEQFMGPQQISGVVCSAGSVSQYRHT